MDLPLTRLDEVLADADRRLSEPRRHAGRVWPTGFAGLDTYLGGGFRSGELVLLGGPQGLGKTTWVLQVARNVARSGRPVVIYSYEHDMQTLLERLVALEAGEIAGIESPGTRRVREIFEATDLTGRPLEERLGEHKGGVEALERVREYAERLVVHRSLGSRTGLAEVRAGITEISQRAGQLPMVVVDYLQKVHVPAGPAAEDDRVTVVVEALKDLSLEAGVPVVAVVAAHKEGLEAGRRLRVSHLRGSSALAYEADTVLILNNKYDVVARHHLVYDLANAERFRNWAVLSIEKNRSGEDGVDLELRKRFEQSRFEGEARRVKEQLVDERVFVE